MNACIKVNTYYIRHSAFWPTKGIDFSVVLYTMHSPSATCVHVIPVLSRDTFTLPSATARPCSAHNSEGYNLIKIDSGLPEH